MNKVVLIIFIYFTQSLELSSNETKLEQVIKGLNNPWSLSFINNDEIFVTAITEMKVNKKIIDDLSDFLEIEAKNIAKKNNFKFHSLKTDLKKIANENMIHGQIDRFHFNYLGYKSIANSLIKNIY